MIEKKLKELTDFIITLNGITDKNKLATVVKERFDLTKDRTVYYCDSFAIRFSQAKIHNLSNTVLSLSRLQKFDNRPVISCTVLPDENFMLLCNSSCLKKISHSSQQLRIDNIRGSFNHSDILRKIAEYENTPENFSEIFNLHSTRSFEENLTFLVESTNGIVAKNHRFIATDERKNYLFDAPERARKFLLSESYNHLNQDLQTRVFKVKNEIAIAAFIENVKIRGNIIEYLITSDGGKTKDLLIDAIINNKPIPEIKNSNDLGDYNVQFEKYNTKTDIKTKVLFLESNPKAYNIDKLLEFLSTENSVYLLYFVGINDHKEISTFLCPIFDMLLLQSTHIIKQWAGRNSRGVTQFNGKRIKELLNEQNCKIDITQSNEFIELLLNL